MCCEEGDRFYNSAREGGAFVTDCAAVSNRRALRASARRYISRRTSGFSLIEIMVVVVIIGLLAGAVTIGVGKYLDSAKKNRVKSDLATIVTEVKGYYALNGRYPSNDQGLASLGMDSKGLDPWGKPYIYVYPAVTNPDEAFEVYTLGEDGRSGGEGVNADVYSWQIDEVEGAQTP